MKRKPMRPRTLYLHGKHTKNKFHLTVTLSKLPPPGFEYIRDITSTTKAAALRQAITDANLIPKRIKLQMPGPIQTTFTTEEK